MNFSDCSLYGICPQYDNCSITRCSECNMILKFSHLAEHLAKKHDVEVCLKTVSSVSKVEVLSGNKKKSDCHVVVINAVDDGLSKKKNENNVNKKPRTVVKKERKKNRLKDRASLHVVHAAHKDYDDDDNDVDIVDNKANGECKDVIDEDSSFVNCIDNCLLDEIDGHTSTKQQDQSENTSSLSMLDSLLPVKSKVSLKSEIVQFSKPIATGSQNLKVSKKLYDADKHCGVLCSSNDLKPCMRSLTCKKHSINLRRQVSGRSKPFNELVKELKLKKQEKQNTTDLIECVMQPPPVQHEPISVPNPSLHQGSSGPSANYVPYSLCTFNSRLINNSFPVYSYKNDLFRHVFSKTVNNFLVYNNNNNNNDMTTGDENNAVDEEVYFLNSKAELLTRKKPEPALTSTHHVQSTANAGRQTQESQNCIANTNSFIPSPSTLSSSSSSTTSSSSLSSPLTNTNIIQQQKRYVDTDLLYKQNSVKHCMHSSDPFLNHHVVNHSTHSKYIKLPNGASIPSTVPTTSNPTMSLKMPIKMKTK